VRISDEPGVIDIAFDQTHAYMASNADGSITYVTK